MARDPSAIAQRWAQQLGQAGPKITEGVQSVTVAPGQAAARQKSAYINGVTAAQDKWASRVAAVTLSDWQQAMVAKGAPRISQGAQAAQPKFAAFMGKLLPYIDSQRASLPPRGDLGANIARMTAFVQGMAKFRNQ